MLFQKLILKQPKQSSYKIYSSEAAVSRTSQATAKTKQQDLRRIRSYF